ncbi:hypothetical protein [Acetomicrobium sp.]|uniref:hypothetical protein n=1 Tax=Acetomicrobium sp. TaxID=1872099 RepID=UPI002FC93E8D
MAKFLGRNALYEITRDLTLAAQGKHKADTVIKGGLAVNVFTREIMPADIAIYKGPHSLGWQGRSYDWPGNASHRCHRFLFNSRIAGRSHACRVKHGDGHAICPSSASFGTTAIFMDPHEIANVLGVKGSAL